MTPKLIGEMMFYTWLLLGAVLILLLIGTGASGSGKEYTPASFLQEALYCLEAGAEEECGE